MDAHDSRLLIARQSLKHRSSGGINSASTWHFVFAFMIAVLAACFSASDSAAQKLSPKEGASAQPKSLTQSEKDIIALGSRCVIFYEGNDLTQNHSSCCTNDGRITTCWSNDEARSMQVFGPAGTTITVFDSPGSSTSDDYFVLEKCDANPVTVGSFESPTDRVNGSCWSYFYSGGNGLDGKVSSFRWYDPR